MEPILVNLAELLNMPRISEDIRKQTYLEGMVKRLQKLYVYGEAHPDEKPALEANLEGFVEAGLLIRLVTRAELQEVIDAQHIKIFGMSREQRKKEKAGASDNAELERDWSGYDLPPSSRGRNSA